MAGRSKDLIDVIEWVKLGKVPIDEMSKCLVGKDLETFQRLATVATLEMYGQTKKARRLLVTLLANSVSVRSRGARP